MKDLISVIIPTYKRSEMLERAINSVLNQSYANIEIIVVDDNNPDSEYRKSTAKFMEKYKNNKKIRYVKMKQNGGGALARNEGISQAKGSYVAFLDDDDYFLDDKLRKQIEFMKKNNLDASFTACETYDETQNKLVKVKRYNNFNQYDDVLKFHLVEMIVGTQTFMYKKEVLDKIDGFSKVPAGQEFYLMYKTIKNGFKVGYLDEILTRLCIHSGERITTGKGKIKAEKFLYNVKKEHFDILTYTQRRKVKYIYKYNIWQRYKSSNSYKQYLWLFYILLSHPIIILKKVFKYG
ncbi:MAG: glycosyltransferase family 2 protein [Bacilli bacterium]|nr:glycosyltransferase family 2 protein [Bacilli bacterium]